MLSSTTPCGGTWASASSGFDRLRPGLRRKEGRACAGKLGEQPTDVCVRVCVKGSRLHAPSRRNISARPKSRWCGGTRYYRMTPSRPATPGYETCAALGPYAARSDSSSSAFSGSPLREVSLSGQSSSRRPAARLVNTNQVHHRDSSPWRPLAHVASDQMGTTGLCSCAAMADTSRVGKNVSAAWLWAISKAVRLPRPNSSGRHLPLGHTPRGVGV